MKMTRRDFISGTSGAAATVMSLKTFGDEIAGGKKSSRQPVMFIGHGSPMNIVRDNAFTKSLRTLGEQTEKPKALLVVSAHWLTSGETSVSTNPKPQTIYDFGGFPDELYKVRYEAPGQPAIAHDVATNVKSVKIHEDHEMGLDHGAWSILHHMWPKADVPVFQLSIDYAKPPQFHYDLGRELRGLRDKGVLVIGSGNIVHNLRRIEWEEDAEAYDWTTEFDAWAKAKLLARDDAALIAYDKHSAARLAVPTNDHYLPMLYTLGLLDAKEQIRFTHESFQNASISMRCFQSA
jgi:4,5-DOPA dioxygenase extradiol